MRAATIQALADPERVGILDGPVWNALVEGVCAGDNVALATLATTNARWLGFVVRRSRRSFEEALGSFTIAVFSRPVDAVELRREATKMIRGDVRRDVASHRVLAQRVLNSGAEIAARDHADTVAAVVDARRILAGLSMPPAGRRWIEHRTIGTTSSESDCNSYSEWRNRPSTVAAITAAA